MTKPNNERKEIKELRKIIVKHTSEMLDNPNEHDIYPTTKFYNNLEADLETLLKKHALKARIEELSGVRLDYEHRQAETFIDNKQQSILGRILTLKAQLESELKKME